MASAQAVAERLENTSRRSDELSPADFETQAGSQGRESIVATLQADAAIALRDGRLKVAVPAYESDQTAGDGSQQTFALGHPIAESPDTQDVVVWFDGDYYGVPEIDYANNEITVDGPGEVATVHIFYVSSKPATLKLRKVDPSGDKRQPLTEISVGLVHQTNQSEQPETVRFGRGWDRFVGTDMELQATVDAPYVVRFEDPDGDGAVATNALLSLRVYRSSGTVQGLTSVVTDAM